MWTSSSEASHAPRIPDACRSGRREPEPPFLVSHPFAKCRRKDVASGRPTCLIPPVIGAPGSLWKYRITIESVVGSKIGLRTSQGGHALHLFLVDLDLAFFFHRAAQVFDVEVFELLTLLLHQSVFLFVPVLLDLRLGGFLYFEHLYHCAVGTSLNRAADLAGFHAEHLADRSGHRAQLRHLRRAVHQIAGLERSARFFRSLVEVMLGMSAIGEFLRLLSQQL